MSAGFAREASSVAEIKGGTSSHGRNRGDSTSNSHVYVFEMIYIARPDKLRVEYDGDVPFLIVATGKLLVLYDGELQQTSYLPLHSSPASVLIRERVDLSDEMNVSEIERAPGVLRLKLVEREDPAKGAIYLTFADPPLRLREWTVIDAEGQATQVALVNSEFGLDLDPVLFMYSAPGPDQYSQ